jgi:hypothetical protein
VRRLTTALLLTALLAGATARAEEIQLKDGTKITGKLIGVNGDTLQIKTAYGDINVPRTEIVSITFPENQPKKADAATAGAVRPVDETLSAGAYVNRSGNFTLQIPKEWKLTPNLLEQNSGLIAALASSDETQILLVTPETFAGTLDTYRVLVENSLKEGFSDYQQVEENDLTLDGHKALRIVSTGTKKGTQTPFKFLVYLIALDGRVERLTFLTLVPFYKDGEPTFEKIAASYHSTAK